MPDPNQWIDPLGLQNLNFGELYGIPGHVQSGIAAQGQRDYDCWLKTGQICQLEVEPLFDYALCQRGTSVSVINLHNGNVYHGYSNGFDLYKGKSKQTMGDIAKKENNSKYKVGPSSLDKLKKMFNASCGVGHIFKKDLKKFKAEDAVDNFVTGMGVNVTGSYGFIKLGITKPVNSSLLDFRSSTAVEVSLGAPSKSVSVNGGYTIDNKIIRTQ